MRLFVTVLLLFAFATIAQEFKDYESAYAAYETGDIDDSYIFLKRSIKNNPDHLPSKILMAEILALSGYYIDALAEFDETLNAGADPNLVLESYIRILMILKDFGRILDLDESKLTPSKMGFLFSAKATASQVRGDDASAAKYHKKALEIAPTSVVVLNTAAKYYLYNDELKDVHALLVRSIITDSGVAETYKLLADYYAKTQEQQKRIEALQQGLKIVDSHPLILRELVSAYTNNGDYQSAKAVLEKALETTPGDPLASLLLSWVSSQLGEVGTSKDTLNTLINNLNSMKSSDLSREEYTLFVSAMANYAANNLEIARQQFEQYLNKNPKNFNAAVLLAEIYQREESYLAAANTLEEFESEVNNDISLIVNLCTIYVKANQNHKCDELLDKNRPKFGKTPGFVQAESGLLAARGKLNLALENLDNLNTSQTSVIAQRAVLAIQDNKFDRANEEINKLLNIRANDPDFLNLKASVLKKQNHIREAEDIYEKIIQINPNHYSANFNLMHIYLITNRLSIAKNKARNLIEKRPKDVELLLMYGKILTKKREYDEAFETLSLAESLSRRSTETEQAFVDLYTKTGEYDKALVRVNRLLKNNIVDANLIRQKAKLNFALGNAAEARQNLKVLFGLVGNDSQALFELSDLQGKYSDLEGAMLSLKRADTLTPYNIYINRNIAKLAMVQNELYIAEEKLKWLVEQAPNDPDILMLQGDYAISQNNKPLAAKFYHTAIRVKPSLAPALIGAYQLAIENVGVNGFIDIFSNLAADPEKNVFATHLLGDYYYTNEDYENAKIAYISVAGMFEYSPIPMILNNLANIYIIEGKIDAAYNFAQQAYEIIQQDSAVLDTIGWISVLRGQLEQGLNLLREAYSMNAQDSTVRYHIAYTLHKLGRNSESKRELKILLSDFPSFPTRKLALELQKTVLSSDQISLVE